MKKLLRSFWYICLGWLIATVDKKAGKEIADLIDSQKNTVPVHEIVSCEQLGSSSFVRPTGTVQEWGFNGAKIGRLVAVFLNQRDQEARIVALRIGSRLVFQSPTDGAPEWRDLAVMLSKVCEVAQPGERIVVYLDRKVSACRLCFELEPVEVEHGVNEVADGAFTRVDCSPEHGYEVKCSRCLQRTKDATFDAAGWLCRDCKAEINGQILSGKSAEPKAEFGYCPRCRALCSRSTSGSVCGSCGNALDWSLIGKN